MPKPDIQPGIDTKDLGLALEIHTPRSKKNRHRSKYLVIFDTGIEMLVPEPLFLPMTLHLREAD